MSGTTGIREIGDHEMRALVTVETMDRLIGQVLREHGKELSAEVVKLLEAASEEAQIRACTAVKDVTTSDLIAESAREHVARAKRRMGIER